MSKTSFLFRLKAKQLGWLLALTTLLVAHLYTLPSYAARGEVNVFYKYDKIIWIDQARQWGAAYSHGTKVVEFPILSGDDETPTPPGIYTVKRKDPNYYSRKYDTPMPYSLFFDVKNMRAVHEGALPDRRDQSDWASHGCIHVEEPYMRWLFNWAEVGRTVVVIRGHRVWEDEGEDRPGQPREWLVPRDEDEGRSGQHPGWLVPRDEE